MKSSLVLCVTVGSVCDCIFSHALYIPLSHRTVGYHMAYQGLLCADADRCNLCPHICNVPIIKFYTLKAMPICPSLCLLTVTQW